MENMRGLMAGTVSAVLPDTHRVRVIFEDRDDLPSAELVVLTARATSGVTETKSLPKVGDQVLCAFLGNGHDMEEGFVLGSNYDEAHPPHFPKKEHLGVSGEGDRLYLRYDEENKCFELKGPVKITGEVALTGNMTVSGSLSVSGNVAAGSRTGGII